MQTSRITENRTKTVNTPEREAKKKVRWKRSKVEEKVGGRELLPLPERQPYSKQMHIKNVSGSK